VLLTVGVVGSLVVARVVLALLLAVAPAMAGFLLFRSTQGMSEGWLRAIAGFALAPLGVLTLATVELAILGPMLARLLSAQAAGRFEPADVTPIGLVALVFALATVAALRALARIAAGLRLPSRRDAPTAGARAVTILETSAATTQPPVPAAARLALSLEAAARRDEARAAPARAHAAVVSALGRIAGPAANSPAQVFAPAGPAAFAPAPDARSIIVRAPRRSRAATRRDG
jgi:type IV secretion system protein VirB6